MKVFYTYKARQDLHDIYDYISFTLLAPEAARNTTERILKAVRSLSSLPERNPLYKGEPGYSQGVRFITVNNYMIFYTINKDTNSVSIARIMYGARELSRQLEETTEW